MWILNDELICGKYFLNYDRKTITVYRNIVDYSFFNNGLFKRNEIIIIYITLFLLLIGMCAIIIGK